MLFVLLENLASSRSVITPEARQNLIDTLAKIIEGVRKAKIAVSLLTLLIIYYVHIPTERSSLDRSQRRVHASTRQCTGDD